MKLDVRFPDLITTKRTMQARDVHWNSSVDMMKVPDFLIELAGTGIEIELEEVTGSDNGLLVYKGQHVLLYIKDTRQDRHTLLYDPDNSRRFHIADKCKTLESMRADNRYDRYVVTNRTDGLFLVDAEDLLSRQHEEIEAPLRPCKNCLKELAYKQYGQKSAPEKATIWRSFSIEKFFAEYSVHFRVKPKYTDQTFPSGGYSPDWVEISKARREAANWTCEKCNVDLHSKKNLLHVHHKNGVRSDNSRQNLEVLCAACHGDEPAHGRMHIPQSSIRNISNLRARPGDRT
jgi:hypothetical protein